MCKVYVFLRNYASSRQKALYQKVLAFNKNHPNADINVLQNFLLDYPTKQWPVARVDYCEDYLKTIKPENRFPYDQKVCRLEFVVCPEDMLKNFKGA